MNRILLLFHPLSEIAGIFHKDELLIGKKKGKGHLWTVCSAFLRDTESSKDAIFQELCFTVSGRTGTMCHLLVKGKLF